MPVDEAILEVLKEIRDEGRQTNSRLDQTNARLESVEEEVRGLGRPMAESEMRLATEVLSLAGVTRDVRDLLTRADLGTLHSRVRALEELIGKRE